MLHPALALGCLSKLCDCVSSVLHLRWRPVIEGVQSPVSTSKGDLSPQQDSGWKLDPQAQLLKCVNLYNAEGPRSVSPTSPT